VATCEAIGNGVLLPYIAVGTLQRGTLWRTSEIDPDKFVGCDGYIPMFFSPSPPEGHIPKTICPRSPGRFLAAPP
jgi:hypothetical protein